MITKQLKAHFHTGEPVIQEYSALMNATFEYYRETRALFFDKLPDKLHQSELVSLINVDLKNRLFSQAFCETIQQAIKALHRVIIRLEDLQAEHPAVSEVFNNLSRLIKIGERVAGLYQLHWELYRYQNRADEREMVAFLLEIDTIAKEWEKFQAGHTTVRALVDALSGRPPPEHIETLVVSYRRDEPAHFSTGTLKALLDFVDAGYRFVCTVRELDPEANPLTLLQVEVETPVELHLGVPKIAEDPLRRLLQYLFLKDMLKGEMLLKFVCEAIIKDFGGEKGTSATAVTAFQKNLSTALKQLPPDGDFTISGRTFPNETIPVLQEFTKYLEEKKIKTDALLKAKGTSKTGGRTRSTVVAKPPPEPGHETTPSHEAPTLLPEASGDPNSKEREHIRILTDRSR